MSEKTLFSKIIDGEIPSEIVHEDEHCFAIRDINPQAPLHLLVIPRKPIPMLSDGEADDGPLFGHLLLTAAQLARQSGFDNFRTVVNNGAGAGQSVFHLHVHVLAGRDLRWPPG
ncbi:MAG: histidine triad nucleotide-binding protein [Gammaproteobacteria bacterium]|nr:histidine triad nucleotide-binding protein [Gammaproteobacteria bacterium]